MGDRSTKGSAWGEDQHGGSQGGNKEKYHGAT